MLCFPTPAGGRALLGANLSKTFDLVPVPTHDVLAISLDLLLVDLPAPRMLNTRGVSSFND